VDDFLQTKIAIGGENFEINFFLNVCGKFFFIQGHPKKLYEALE